VQAATVTGEMTTFDKREAASKRNSRTMRSCVQGERTPQQAAWPWAAGQLGSADRTPTAYAKEVVVADFEEAGDDDVFRKVRKDFEAKGVKAADQQIRTMMTSLMEDIPTSGGKIAPDGRAPRRSRSPAACSRRNRLHRMVRIARATCRRDGAREGFNTSPSPQHGLWAPRRRSPPLRPSRGGPRHLSCACRSARLRSQARARLRAEGIIAPMINTVADAKGLRQRHQISAVGERSWDRTGR